MFFLARVCVDIIIFEKKGEKFTNSQIHKFTKLTNVNKKRRATITITLLFYNIIVNKLLHASYCSMYYCIKSLLHSDASYLQEKQVFHQILMVFLVQIHAMLSLFVPFPYICIQV